MVPRALFFNRTSRDTTSRQPTRKDPHDAFPSQDLSGLRPPTSNSAPTNTSPVVVPSARLTRTRYESAGRDKILRDSRSLPRHSSATYERPLPNSIASVLEATAIPVPRRNWTASRRLPQGNHAEEFNKLITEGVRPRDDQSADGSGNTVLGILLSPPEDKPHTRNDDDIETPPTSLLSISTESMPSLEHDLDSQSSGPLSSPPSSQRSHSEKRNRRPSHSEDCAFDHPLLETPLQEPQLVPILDGPTSDTNTQKSTTRSFPRLGSTFKSNLTASLRAIRSAAQTVSAFATPPIQQDDFLTRSLFTITPKLTDDRRPPPMSEPPSPALRRYLNPITVSPAEMHIYHEHPPECSEAAKCPVSIQMQTYHPSGTTNGKRKGGFHLSAIDRDLPYDPETVPGARQREPRENSDFLRMVVLEMNMRRSGKLRDDIPTHARIWLPPRKSHRYLSFTSYGHENAVPARWIGMSVECA